MYILPLFSSIGFLLQCVLKAGEKMPSKIKIKEEKNNKNQPISFFTVHDGICACMFYLFHRDVDFPWEIWEGLFFNEKEEKSTPRKKPKQTMKKKQKGKKHQNQTAVSEAANATD